MVLRHFNLREQPFGVTPDTRFLYASGTHREALASLLYGVESGLGFITLTAKPGMGKTTLLFEALRRLGDNTRTVFLFQTITTPIDLVHALLIDLGVKEIPSGLVEMQALLNEILVAQCSTGKRLVVAIDEAQNLGDSVLEAVRMLSNFETSREKLMQIILCGQLQLAEKLASPQLLQLRQRISIFAHLKPLTAIETAAYIQHRLRISGYDSTVPLFSDAALALIARHSEGIPRNINNLCFNALSIGCALRRTTIDADVIEEVISDLDVESLDEPVEAVEFVVNLPVPAVSVAAPVVATAPPRDPVPPLASEPVAISRPLFGHVEESSSSDYDDDYEQPQNSGVKILLWVVAAGVILALFGWLGIKDYKALTADGTIHSSSKQAPAAAVPATTPTALIEGSTEGNLQIGPRTRSVQVVEGQSLSQICTEHYGKCRPDLLRQIVKLNPSVVNPDHIESGQRIVIPIEHGNSIEN